MAILTFDRQGVERLIAHAKSSPKHSPTYNQRAQGIEQAEPALWLIGDEGVFLVSNGFTDNEPPDDKLIVYANEVNPKTMPLDEWWEAKRRTFGGDDGVESLSVEDVERALVSRTKDFRLEITPEEIVLFGAFP